MSSLLRLEPCKYPQVNPILGPNYLCSVVLKQNRRISVDRLFDYVALRKKTYSGLISNTFILKVRSSQRIAIGE